MTLLKSLPYESCVTVKPIIGYVCPTCERSGEWAFQDSPGFCDMYHDWELWADQAYGNGEFRRVRKRKLWRCPGNDDGTCEFYFLSRRALLEHEHGFI